MIRLYSAYWRRSSNRQTRMSYAAHARTLRLKQIFRHVSIIHSIDCYRSRIRCMFAICATRNTFNSRKSNKRNAQLYIIIVMMFQFVPTFCVAPRRSSTTAARRGHHNAKTRWKRLENSIEIAPRPPHTNGFESKHAVHLCCFFTPPLPLFTDASISVDNATAISY